MHILILLFLLTFPAIGKNFYAGAFVGLNTQGSDYHHLSIAKTESIKTSAQEKSPAYGLFFGYGCNLSQIYMGIDADLFYINRIMSPLDTSASDDDSRTLKVTTKTMWQSTLALRLGTYISKNALAYLKLGVGYTPWQAKYENISTGQTVSAATSQLIITKKNHDFAPALGVGCDITVGNNLFLRFDYTIHFSKRLNASQRIQNNGNGFSNYTIDNPTDNTVGLYHIQKVSSQRASLGLGYQF